MNQKKVSIIVTTFNSEEYVAQCLNSIIAQTHTNIEVIIVDDLSNDKTIQILETFDDERIKIIKNSTNVGVSKSRNIGIAKATGDYITQLDSDDFISKTKIENELKTCLENKGAAFSEHFIVSRDSKVLRSAFKYHKLRNRLTWFGVLYRTQAFGRDWMIPKSISELVKYDESLSLYEDWDYKLRIIKHVDVHYTKSVGTYYRQTNNGLSSATFDKHASAMHAIYDKYSELSWGYKTLFGLLNKKGKLSKILKIIVDNLI